jgi:hypothetical protein
MRDEREIGIDLIFGYLHWHFAMLVCACFLERPVLKRAEYAHHIETRRSEMGSVINAMSRIASVRLRA